jgi:hypothetical protein
VRTPLSAPGRQGWAEEPLWECERPLLGVAKLLALGARVGSGHAERYCTSCVRRMRRTRVLVIAGARAATAAATAAVVVGVPVAVVVDIAEVIAVAAVAAGC